MSCGVVFQIFRNVRFCSPKKRLFVQIMSFYAVAKGRTPGIFMTWADCEAQVKGFSGARYKKFDTIVSAQDFITTHGGSGQSSGPKQKLQNSKWSLNSGSSKAKHIGRTYSTSSNYQTINNSSQSNQQKKSRKSRVPVESDHYDSESSHSDKSDDLDMVISKQMDDIEKRLKSFEKGVDKIIKKGTGRKAILIEPEPKRRRKSGNNGFEEDNDGYVQVYTDGACSANGRSGARAGIGVYWGEGHSHNVSEPVSGRATNNCGEIQAATRAIKQAVQSGVKKLTINTDSQFLINSVTKWMPGWKRKGWKLASGEPVKNEIDFKDLDSVQNKLELKWNYVEAHRGVHGNEMADQLAKAGAAMYHNK